MKHTLVALTLVAIMTLSVGAAAMPKAAAQVGTSTSITQTTQYPTVGKTYYLAGDVTDAAGNGLPSVPVKMYWYNINNPSGEHYYRTVTTDSNGHFVTSGVKVTSPGYYEFDAQFPGGTFTVNGVPTTYAGSDGLVDLYVKHQTHLTLYVSPQQPTYNQGISFVGTLTDESGHVVPDAPITLEFREPGMTWGQAWTLSEHTDSSGTWSDSTHSAVGTFYYRATYAESDNYWGTTSASQYVFVKVPSSFYADYSTGLQFTWPNGQKPGVPYQITGIVEAVLDNSGGSIKPDNAPVTLYSSHFENGAWTAYSPAATVTTNGVGYFTYTSTDYYSVKWYAKLASGWYADAYGGKQYFMSNTTTPVIQKLKYDTVLSLTTSSNALNTPYVLSGYLNEIHAYTNPTSYVPLPSQNVTLYYSTDGIHFVKWKTLQTDSTGKFTAPQRTSTYRTYWWAKYLGNTWEDYASYSPVDGVVIGG